MSTSSAETVSTPGLYVQFGCGLCAPGGWSNFDAGPAFWIQKKLPFLKPTLVKKGFPNYPSNIHYGDVINGLPIGPGSASAVYCSHVLEHLALNECRQTLQNVYRYLAPGGTFRAVLPDLEWLARSYLDSNDMDAASRFMRDSDLGVQSQQSGIGGGLRRLFGRSAHLWMWDYKNLERELQSVGFSAVRRAQYGDNPDPLFREVEDPARWENALGVECRKA